MSRQRGSYMSRRVVENVRTGETFVFDDDWNDSEGRVRQLHYELKGRRRVPVHFHPKTAQSFEVLSGTLWVQVNGERSVLRAGDQMTTLPGAAHSQWNEDAAPVCVIER